MEHTAIPIVFRTSEGDTEVEVQLNRPDATVADLLSALGGDAATDQSRLAVDGVVVEGEYALLEAGLLRGSLVELQNLNTVPRLTRPLRRRRVLAIVGGTHSGRMPELHTSGAVVGRQATAQVRVVDPTVSPAHFRLMGRAAIEDLGSHNGIRIDGEPVRRVAEMPAGALLQFGAVEAVVRDVTVSDRPVGLDASRVVVGGTRAFNRPPTAAPSPDLDPINVPDAPAEKQRSVAFSAATLVGPLVMGVVMVKVMGNIRFALFALMAPIMFVSNYVATRRRNAKESRSSQRRFAADLDVFRDALSDAIVHERRRRESIVPDPAEVVRRSLLPSTRLWERRHDHADYLRLRLGRADMPWSPPVDPKRVSASAELGDAVAAASVIKRCPLDIDLAAGGVVGLVGDRSAALSLARSLIVQASVLHGPADLRVVVLTDTSRGNDWDWTKWLPHTVSAEADLRLLCANPEQSRELMERLLEVADARAEVSSPTRDQKRSPEPTTLVVVDDVSLLTGRNSPTRSVLRGRAGSVVGLVITPTEDRLPSVCDTVVELLDDLGDAEVRIPQSGERATEVLIAGMDEPTSRSCARSLAGFEDPELAVVGGALPAVVPLLSLLGPENVTAQNVRRQWEASGADPGLSVAVGVGEDGPVTLDMIADGPHALVGGTTGSGKSEFLRSFVAGLAANVSPRYLVFVLFDYKGGSAFDECSRLPHTVGMVTDLDEYLGARALQSLEAEMRYREKILRESGMADLNGYFLAGSPAGAMPRVLLVVDEFATLAAELPEFMSALVGIAQRGRSLGIHMVLATQRPSGVVNANIKANTNIRVALRVQDVSDSVDVIDRPDAARIPRGTPGRAFIRLGPSDVVALQMPLSSAPQQKPGAAALAVRPFGFAEGPDPGAQSASDDLGGRTDLACVVDACVAAFDSIAAEPPRRPWLDMFPPRIAHADICDGADPARGVVVAMADDPLNQRQHRHYWQPGNGHLALLGMAGSGTSSALVAGILAAARCAEPDDLHVYCVDFGGGTLAQLENLPHVGAVINANETERQARLVGMLGSEVGRRRELSADQLHDEPQLIVAVDGFASLLAQFDAVETQATLDALRGVIADGVGLGIAFAFTCDRPMAIPMRMSGTVVTRLMFRHADMADFNSVGVRHADLPRLLPGRAVDAGSRLVVQVGFVADIAEAIAACRTGVGATRGPASIDTLPVSVPVASVLRHLAVADALQLPVGIAEEDRTVKSVVLYPGEHLLVAGKARSGVSTSLRMFARLMKTAYPDSVIVAVAGDRSPLRRDRALFDAVGAADQLRKVFELAAMDTERGWTFVVDDAHAIDDLHGLGVLADAEHCRFLVGGRSEQLHGQFNHWTRRVRRSGTGLLLQPRLDCDGDLLGVRLPRRLTVPMVPGRGFVVAEGGWTLVQVAGADLSV